MGKATHTQTHVSKLEELLLLNRGIKVEWSTNDPNCHSIYNLSLDKITYRGCLIEVIRREVLVKLNMDIASFKALGQVIVFVVQGIIMATSVYLKAMFFRGWLPTEIATDLGYHLEATNSRPVHLLLLIWSTWLKPQLRGKQPPQTMEMDILY